MLTGKLSGITVVDIDDPTLAKEAIKRFGEPLIIVATPSGGQHLYYRHSGEKCRNLRKGDGVAIDIKGQGGYVLVPPSRGANGKSYAFVRGGWEDLPHLSAIRSSALENAPASVTPIHTIGQGERNDRLFEKLRKEAKHRADFTKLENVEVHAFALNRSNEPPLPDDEVKKTARSVWKMKNEGRILDGSAGEIRLRTEWVRYVLTEYPKCGPDALALYMTLKTNHGARDARREPFAVAAREMAYKTLPWCERRIRDALKVLTIVGLLKCVHQGGKGPGDASLFQFSSPTLL